MFFFLCEPIQKQDQFPSVFLDVPSSIYSRITNHMGKVGQLDLEIGLFGELRTTDGPDGLLHPCIYYWLIDRGINPSEQAIGI